MIIGNGSSCPDCGESLKHYDNVLRIVRTKRGKSKWIKIRRMRCETCGHIHRELPDNIVPYKQYDAEIVKGVLEGFITPATLGYEDYPCEITMIRWVKSPRMQLLL